MSNQQLPIKIKSSCSNRSPGSSTQHLGIVTSTYVALMIHEMKRNSTSDFTIIAIDITLMILEFGWHAMQT
jgi:hypothetical protein